MTTPQDEYVYSPGETKLVNTSEHSHTKYIGGPTNREGISRSKFDNSFELRYDDDHACLKVYELDFYYRVLSDEEFFQDVMDMYGEVIGCWCLPDDYCHGIIIVDFLTHGYERGTDKDVDEVSSDDEWVLNYIGKQLGAMDSTNLPPMGIAFRARLEERLSSMLGETSDVSFAAHIEDHTDGWSDRLN